MVLSLDEIISPKHLPGEIFAKAFAFIGDYQRGAYRRPFSYYVNDDLGADASRFIVDTFDRIDKLIDLDFERKFDPTLSTIDIHYKFFSGEDKGGEKGLATSSASSKGIWNPVLRAYDDQYELKINIDVEPSNWTSLLKRYPALTELTATTILHEIGHALGLRHPNDNPTDPRYNTLDTTLSYNFASSGSDLPFYTENDIKALIQLWGVEKDKVSVITPASESASSAPVKSISPADMITDTDWEEYVDRYPLTLGAVYNGFFSSGGLSKAAFGKNHYISVGEREGRILKPSARDVIASDYGAYVENYGSTLLDVFRQGIQSRDKDGNKMTMFQWGKWHYENYGKKEGRSIDGGVDWGSLVQMSDSLMISYNLVKLIDKSLTLFRWGNENQSEVLPKLAGTLKLGSDKDDTLSGSRVFGLGGNDIVIGSNNSDLLSGGFGDDIIIGTNQYKPLAGIPALPPSVAVSGSPVFKESAEDLVYGGPGNDLFVLSSGSLLKIQDFRKGSDAIGIGSFDKSAVSLRDTFESGSFFTEFLENATGQTLAKVYGQRSVDFAFATSLRGLANVFA